MLGKDLTRNQVILGENAALFSGGLIADRFNWVGIAPPDAPVACTAKTRYQASEAPCVAQRREDGSVQIHFDQSIRAITPGQAVVLYEGDTVLGGGTICRAEP